MAEIISNPAFKKGNRGRHPAKAKRWEFKPVECGQNFFWFPRWLVTNGHWAAWPTSAKAILPAFLYFANDKGESFPSIETLSTICGMHRTTVMDGEKFIKAQNSEIYPVKSWVRKTALGYVHNCFRFPIIQNTRGMRYPFRNSVLEGGNWAMLSQSAKSLYIVLRSYSGITNDFFESGDDVFEERSLELIGDLDMGFYRDAAGIKSTSTFNGAWDNLKECGLLSDYEEDQDDPCINLDPTGFYDSDYLNERFCKKIRP